MQLKYKAEIKFPYGFPYYEKFLQQKTQPAGWVPLIVAMSST